jgi:hypothetical protein
MLVPRSVPVVAIVPVVDIDPNPGTIDPAIKAPTVVRLEVTTGELSVVPVRVLASAVAVAGAAQDGIRSLPLVANVIT